MPLIQLLEVLIVVGVSVVAGKIGSSRCRDHQINSEPGGGRNRSGSVVADVFGLFHFASHIRVGT